MAKFEITGPDGKKYRVEGESAEGALSALRKMLGDDGKAGPDGMTTRERVAAAKSGTLAEPSPERLAQQAEIDQTAEDRMVLDSNGGVANWLTKGVQGLPFIGEYSDEVTGALGGAVGALTGDASLGDRAMGRQRAVQNAMDRQNPKTSMALQMAGGVLGSIPLAAAAGPSLLANAPATMLGKTIGGIGLGAVSGGIEGAVSGYGAGNDGDRLASAKSRGILGAGLGAVVGGAAPILGAGVRALVERAKGMDVTTIAKTFGISRDAAIALKPDLEALDFGTASKALQTAGPEAMLADAGISTREALDAAITGGGKAARIGVDAVSGRAAESGGRLGKVMDVILGVPRGVKAVSKGIAARTAPARKKAYDVAYKTPIDYAADTGRNIEEVLGRVDGETLSAAVKEANSAMRAEGIKNQQIMAILDSKGDVTFKEMPNVQQLDEIKKGLDAVARAETDELTGKISGKGLRAKKLAGELRSALGEAAPAYKTAVRLGGDKIATETAMDTGRKLFTPGMTRERVAEVMKDASIESKDAARQGIREYVDDTLARVRRSYDNPEADTTETLKLLNTLSSRDAREKLVMVLGEAKADRLLKEIDAAGKQFGTRQAIATGSATGRRESRARALDDQLAPGIVGTAGKGNPFETVGAAVKFLTRSTPQNELARRQEVLADVARALTEIRGPQAEAALKLVEKAISGQPIKNDEAVRIARFLSASGVIGGYQTGQKSLASPQRAQSAQ
jgi:hypothetical protein